MGKKPTLLAEDFGYKETRFLYMLFEHSGGCTAVANSLGLPNNITTFQWRDRGTIPVARVPVCAGVLGVNPLLLNYAATHDWYSYFLQTKVPKWSTVLAELIKDKPIMTRSEYNELVSLPSVVPDPTE